MMLGSTNSPKRRRVRFWDEHICSGRDSSQSASRRVPHASDSFEAQITKQHSFSDGAIADFLGLSWPAFFSIWAEEEQYYSDDQYSSDGTIAEFLGFPYLAACSSRATKSWITGESMKEPACRMPDYTDLRADLYTARSLMS